MRLELAGPKKFGSLESECAARNASLTTHPNGSKISAGREDEDPMDVPLDEHCAHHARTTWRKMRDNQDERALGERGREADLQIVKNRKFLPKALRTGSRRSEKWLAITLTLMFPALSRLDASW